MTDPDKMLKTKKGNINFVNYPNSLNICRLFMDI